MMFSSVIAYMSNFSYGKYQIGHLLELQSKCSLVTAEEGWFGLHSHLAELQRLPVMESLQPLTTVTRILSRGRHQVCLHLRETHSDPNTEQYSVEFQLNSLLPISGLFCSFGDCFHQVIPFKLTELLTKHFPAQVGCEGRSGLCDFGFPLQVLSFLQHQQAP